MKSKPNEVIEDKVNDCKLVSAGRQQAKERKVEYRLPRHR